MKREHPPELGVHRRFWTTFVAPKVAKGAKTIPAREKYDIAFSGSLLVNPPTHPKTGNTFSINWKVFTLRRASRRTADTGKCVSVGINRYVREG